jgi:hypothetical protein
MSSKYERSTGWSTHQRGGPMAAPAQRAVYDGDERVGSIQEWGRAFIARDKRGQQLGAFPTMDDAIGAISAAAAEEQRPS